jgi:hypothetical protein
MIFKIWSSSPTSLIVESIMSKTIHKACAKMTCPIVYKVRSTTFATILVWMRARCTTRCWMRTFKELVIITIRTKSLSNITFDCKQILQYPMVSYKLWSSLWSSQVCDGSKCHSISIDRQMERHLKANMDGRCLGLFNLELHKNNYK